MRILVALGGNALLERDEKPDADIEERHIRQAAEALAPLCRDHDVVVTHGNGPQVGLLALESGADPALSRAYPLDALGAQTQGMIGYWLAQELGNVSGRSFAALVCRCLVDQGDPAFAHPSKFVGQVYSEAEARALARKWDWAVAADGQGWRRVVPSPQPQEVVELAVIEGLLTSSVGVICCGGGGIPVVRCEEGQLRGVEAVIDKDRTACLLGRRLQADVLLILTDVAAVEAEFGTPSSASAPPCERRRAAGDELPGRIDGSEGPSRV